MRRDIQFLRGIAVLSVVFYHADIWPISNGYLGVDIFFVISGFLITSIVLSGLESHNFSFTQFYIRRARRLLPALYCTLLVTTVVAYVFLTDREWTDYRAQLYGAISFTANLVLPFQVGYFDDASETKLLLHIWSLSLEEQYYLLLPLILFITRQSSRGPVLFVLAAFSLLLNQVFIQHVITFSWAPQITSPDWAFYLLPTRAWELLVGSMTAWWMLKFPDSQIPVTLKAGALVGLIVILFYSIDYILLRGNTIAIVLLTSLLIAGKDGWLPNWTLVKGIEKVGDWSYSLYLIHWPLLVLAQIAYLELVPKFINALIVSTSLLLAFLQYRYIEQRFRYVSGQQRRVTIPLLAATGAIIVLSLPVVVTVAKSATGHYSDFKDFRRTNYGFHWSCSRGNDFVISDACRDTPNPRVAVWGDSFAMHLIPGLRKNSETKNSLIQITASGCNPIKDLTGIYGSIAAARACVDFNDKALQYIMSTDSIKSVILSSPFGYFYGGYKQYLYKGDAVSRDTEIAISALVDTVKLLQQAGKHVLVISPPPLANFNVGECLERQATGAILLGWENCDIDIKTHRERIMPVMQALNRVQAQTNIKIIWLSDLLCDEAKCRTMLNGVPLYRDQGHLSYLGSEALLQNISLF